MTVHCFTSATFAYLDRVRVLGETLRRFHPDWILWLCLPDEEPPTLRWNAAEEAFCNVVRLTELGVPNVAAWTFEHDIVELCTAVKGQMLCRLLDQGAEKVIFLDPDIAVFNELTSVLTLLDSHDVVLTPHLVDPEDDLPLIIENEVSCLKHGVYNLGFLAVANTANGRRVAEWWRDRLLSLCFDDIPNGLFTDQRWCDLAPALFDGVHVLRDPGFNVASWNLKHRPIAIGGDGHARAGNSLLRFFHFTKVANIGELMIERHAGDHVDMFEILKWYKSRLVAHAVEGLPDKWWAYSTFDSGEPIERRHRLEWRSNKELRQSYPDPFAAGPTIFS